MQGGTCSTISSNDSDTAVIFTRPAARYPIAAMAR